MKTLSPEGHGPDLQDSKLDRTQDGRSCQLLLPASRSPSHLPILSTHDTGLVHGSVTPTLTTRP